MRNKLYILLLAFVIITTGILMITQKEQEEGESFYIGDFHVIFSKDYKPIGKEVEQAEEIGTYRTLEDLKMLSSIDTSFIDELSQYDFQNAHSYTKLHQGKKVNSWGFHLKNDSTEKSLIIFINPGFHNPIYIRESANPQRIKLGSEEILLFHPISSTTIFLAGDHLDSLFKAEENEKTTAWIEAYNLTEEEALEVARVFCGLK